MGPDKLGGGGVSMGDLRAFLRGLVSGDQQAVTLADRCLVAMSSEVLSPGSPERQLEVLRRARESSEPKF